MPAKTFEQLKEGEAARWSHQISAKEVDDFARLSGDVNPLHQNDGFARQHGFRGRVVHGMLINSFLSTVLGTVLPGPGTLWLSQKSQFLLPVYVGDSIEIVVRVVHRSELLRTLALETTVLNQRGETVSTGEARVMMLAVEKNIPWNEMVAVVTGGSRGIGAAVSQALGEKGVRVVVNYHQRQDAAQQVVASVKKGGGEAIAVQADISTFAGTQALAEAALKKFGRVDVLINNATPPIQRKLFMDLSWEEVEKFWKSYVQSTFMLSKEFVPGMKERGFGRIVNVLTTAIWGSPPQEMAGYVAAKSASWGLVRSMAVEFAPHGITVNAVSPSAVVTDQWQEVPETRLRAMTMRIPLRRLATVENVAQAVMFLVGKEGSYLTGVNFPIAGGEVM